MEARKRKVEGLLTKAGLDQEQIHDIVYKLNDMGYFKAPASTIYHMAYEGGLVDHSINVCEELVRLTEDNGLIWKTKRGPYIVGLLHDLCKCDAYLKTKDGYTYNNDKLLSGHGDKSAILAGQILRLTDEEVCCIRYHMGAYYKKDWEGFDRAIKQYPNTLWTHTADMIASKLIES